VRWPSWVAAIWRRFPSRLWRSFQRVYAANGGFADPVDARVFPDFLTVTDSPSATEFHRQPRYGGYRLPSLRRFHG
jgi:hypothetical protein